MEYLLAALCALSLLFSILSFLAARRAKEQANLLLDALNESDKRAAERMGVQLSAEMRQSRMEFSQLLGQNARTIDENMHRLYAAVNAMRTDQLKTFDALSERMQARLTAMQQDNQTQLDRMRATVDEKLQKTLDEKLGQSFRTVSERLEAVYKGLGEMQTLATGVGDLKRVLLNVKTQGVLGEIQLSRILEQLLTPAQYLQNVVTKRGSRDFVEYAIRLPGRTDDDTPVLLPIDAKFPLADYQALCNAYEANDTALIDVLRKRLETAIKKCAKDISDKYIDPPQTTNFAILFLPIEGLYAEVARNNGLLETLQNDYRINVAGPTTLSALLNSLQMGFKTLAIEQRSNEIAGILKSVKAEFLRFREALTTAQNRIKQADADIDRLVGVRTNQIIRSLRDVELPKSTSDSSEGALPSENDDALIPPLTAR